MSTPIFLGFDSIPGTTRPILLFNDIISGDTIINIINDSSTLSTVNVPEFYTYNMISKVNCELRVTTGTATSFSLYSFNGSLINTVNQNTTTITSLGELIANEPYYLVLGFNSSATMAPSYVHGTIRTFASENVENFFPGGFNINAGIGLPTTFDQYGNATVTFTDFNVIEGQPIIIGTTSEAIKNATYTETCSDTTVFQNISAVIPTGISINLMLIPKKTTVFTGTVTFGVTEAGPAIIRPVFPVKFSDMVQSENFRVIQKIKPIKKRKISETTLLKKNDENLNLII